MKIDELDIMKATQWEITEAALEMLEFDACYCEACPIMPDNVNECECSHDQIHEAWCEQCSNCSKHCICNKTPAHKEEAPGAMQFATLWDTVGV